MAEKNIPIPNKKIALSSTRLYRVWRGMKKRCYNPNATGYVNYGGKGITICDEWLVFENFYNWAISDPLYTDSMTIERIDINLGYSPTNCTWKTKAEQNKNRRNSHYVFYKGKKYTLHELSQMLHFDRTCFRNWEFVLGNSEKALDYILSNKRHERKAKYGRTERINNAN